MQERKLKASVDVNIRKGSPTVRADNAVGVIHSGQEFSCFCELISDDSCEEINGNRSWYKLAGNLYMWSGGFEMEVNDDCGKEFIPLSDTISYQDFFKDVIPDEFLQLGGQGVVVAVLDTGVCECHPDFDKYFDQELLPSKDYTGSAIGYRDVQGHGSHIAGLIGGRSHKERGVVGIAPKSNIWNIKIRDDQAGSETIWLSKALDELILFAAGNRHIPLVVNMSFQISTNAYERLETKFKALHDSNVMIVAAAGDNTDLIKSFIYYPAYSDLVISAGHLDSTFKLETNKFHDRIDFILPATSLTSLAPAEKNYYQQLTGSSMSTALMSGIVALVMAKASEKSRQEVIRQVKSFAKVYNQNEQLKNIELLTPNQKPKP